jgi:hypothetical protein
VSTIGDSLKLAALKMPEQKAVIVIGDEHHPPKIDLSPVRSFEAIASSVAGIK